MGDSQLHYFLPAWIGRTDERLTADVCVYGGTAAGVVAAATAASRGKSVVLLQPGHTLGGMTTGGLGWTDYGAKGVIGGRSRRFYADLGKEHGVAEEWHFQPSTAQRVIDRYAKESGATVRLYQYLDSVELDANSKRILSIRLLGGLRVAAKVFIDATYEGDLLAKAGVSFHVGREANSVYGETINGVQIRKHHQFSHRVDPFVRPGDPTSGTLPFVNMQDAAPQGSGDGRLQAYNFRVCMTDDPALKVSWAPPERFDERLYELARRWVNTESDEYNDQLAPWQGKPRREPKKFDILTQRTPGGHQKTDTNNHGAVSSDFIGANYGWPEADYAQREAIFQAHVAYQQGYYWFMANDPSVPAKHREAYARWGLPKDEFTATGGWPHQLYVREARRMVGDYVLTEADTQHRRQPEDPVGMGSYNMDSHNCQRFTRLIKEEWWTLNEGDVQLAPAGPYGVSYRSIVPRRGQAANLLVPVCLSSSHIAYGSVRMEPVFMVLAESAATAASLAIDAGSAVQDVPYSKLRPELEEAEQVIAWNGKA